MPGVMLGLALVAVLASTAALEQSNDALSYLVKARDGRRLLHPHHLLFNLAVRALYLGLDWAAGVRDIVLAAQVHNLASTFVALLAVYWIGRRWLGSRLLGLVGMAWYGSTTAIMVYASQAEVYVPAAALLGVAAAFFLALMDSPTSARARAGLVGAWVLAVLYHQTAVLFLVPVAVTVLVARDRALTRAAAAVSALAGAAVLAAYWLAYRVAERESGEVKSFLEFVFSYAVTPGVRWGSISNFSRSGVARLLESHVWGLSTLIPTTPAVLAAIAVAGGAAVVLAWRLAGQRARLLLCFAVSWAATLLIFFLWWLPEETEFAVLSSLPISLAAIACTSTLLASARLGPAGARAVAISLLAVAGLNFWGGLRLEVLPRHRSRGEAYERARFLSTFDDGSTLRLNAFNLSGTLRFYFGGTADSIHVVDNLERTLHVGGARASWMVRAAWDRVIVDLAEIQPGRLHSGRSGFSEPSTWLRMVQWIFNLRADEGAWYADDWEIVADGRGNSYVVVRAGRRALSEPRQLLLQLVGQLEPGMPGRHAFTRWLKAHPGPLEGSLVPP